MFLNAQSERLFFVTLCQIVALLAALGCIACSSNHTVTISGEFPVKEEVFIEVRDYLSGRRVFSEKLIDNHFKQQLSDLPPAIYEVIFSWDRDVLTPRELQNFAKQEQAELPKFYFTSTCWLDPKEATDYQFDMSKSLTQEELEFALLGESDPVEFQIRSDGKENAVYNGYLRLLQDYKNRNLVKKQAINRLFYQANDRRKKDEAYELGKTFYQTWDSVLFKEMIRSEIKFMNDHIQDDAIVAIFCAQINDAEDFRQYAQVYEKFPSDKKLHVDNFIRNVVGNESFK